MLFCYSGLSFRWFLDSFSLFFSCGDLSVSFFFLYLSCFNSFFISFSSFACIAQGVDASYPLDCMQSPTNSPVVRLSVHFECVSYPHVRFHRLLFFFFLPLQNTLRNILVCISTSSSPPAGLVRHPSQTVTMNGTVVTPPLLWRGHASAHRGLLYHCGSHKHTHTHDF